MAQTEYDIVTLMPFRFFLIPDYQEGESAFLAMGHHAFSDGIQFVSLVTAMTVEKDFSELPQAPEPTFWQNLMMNVAAPFAAVRHAINLPFLPLQNNCIKRPAPKERNRVARFSRDFSISAFKEATKAVGCSVNEALHSLIGITLKEYADRRGDTGLSEITITSTYALKRFPTSIEDITLQNHFITMPIALPVTHSFADCVRINKANNRELKGSTQVLGLSTCVGWMLLLPFNLAKVGIGYLARRTTLTYSNLPSPTRNYNLNGAKCRSMCGFLPSVDDMLCGIVGISHGQVLKLSLITDLHCVEYPDEFMLILEQKTE